ncbi:class II fructose-bisphosphate aldolase [Desulforhopalus sp. IMCC35007]|uniref:class II fructose-bisphosphate aldolase n=1 Tax=Desulforhopalus sp. IMCC35007 TaxID=2569543 RepID=UPI0010AE0074|nr:class II fructose-bisphosphate aldolase [Desulforhopalus sp. IMCC35007]TKB09630.1 class II fructose-1,6-bisphosphate aldolase [Desulforhopalus sp. IMCC35007]
MTSPTRYEDLGLVNTKEMFAKAMAGGYAIPAYNFNNMEQLQAIVIGCAQSSSPVILQVSGSARKYAEAKMLPYMVKGAVELVRSMGSSIPIALHLDHGDSFELAKDCIDSGFSSVMIDGSHLSFKENMRLTAEVVQYAHSKNVTVEGELGVLAGVEDEVSSEKSHYTRPEEVEEFVKKTSADSLAISIGTSHGAHKFKLQPGEAVPPLRFDILETIEQKLPGYPIVLHGASSVTPEHVDMINRYGGKLESAVGIPAEQLRRAAKSAVCKINIDSDGRLAMTAVIRKIFAEKPSEFDPRKYLGPARDELIRLIKEKNTNVLGSAGKG